MALTNSLPRIEEHRVTVNFECPHCRSKGSGTAYDLRETIRVSSRVPRWGWQSHWVRCARCKAELHADCAAEDFVGATPSIVNQHVRTYVTFPRRVLAAASLILCWTPVVGVVLALVSLGTNLKTRSWPRWVSIIAIVLAVGANVMMFVTVLRANAAAATPTVADNHYVSTVVEPS
jgi:hypothetical protein